MCHECDNDVAATGDFLDHVIETHARDNVERYQHDSSAQHCIRLACSFRDCYLEDQGVEPLQRLCLALSVAVHRLAVLQQINGGAL